MTKFRHITNSALYLGSTKLYLNNDGLKSKTLISVKPTLIDYTLFKLIVDSLEIIKLNNYHLIKETLTGTQKMSDRLVRVEIGLRGDRIPYSKDLDFSYTYRFGLDKNSNIELKKFIKLAIKNFSKTIDVPHRFGAGMALSKYIYVYHFVIKVI